MNRTVSTPGKITILGEYAVMYGKTGVSAALQERVKVTAKDHQGIRISLNGKTEEYSRDKAKELFLQANSMIRRKDVEGLDMFLEKRFPPLAALAWKCMELKGANEGVELDILYSLPDAAGLGASSAISSAVSAAIIGYKTEVEKRKVFDASMFGDSIAHLTPSGLDCETTIKGGFLSYRKGFNPNRIDVDYELPIVVGDTGKRSKAVDMVKKVEDLRTGDPRANEWLNELDEAAREGLEAIKKQDIQELAFNINKSQELLRHLKVSTPEIENLIITSLRAGAIAAEITGQGGGGAMFALCEKPEDVEKVAEAIRKEGGSVIKTVIGGPGLKVDER